MIWASRDKRVQSTVGPLAYYRTTSLSPDEHYVAAELHSARDKGDLWLLDLRRDSSTRLTFDGAHSNAAVWSPDGSRLAFAAWTGGVPNLHQKLLSRPDSDEPLLPAGPYRVPTDWSPDGRRILYQQGESNRDLWVLSVPDRHASTFLVTEFDEHSGRFSDDGQWIAYVSNESGRDEVYVRSVTSPAERWKISVAGGERPMWGADGREIFYIAPEDIVMSVALKLKPQIEIAGPKPLFTARLQDYSVSSNGERFLLNPTPMSAATHPGSPSQLAGQ